MTNSSFKLRSSRLKTLGFKNYGEYLASPHWQQRRAAYEAAHERRCHYCDSYGHHLHHRTYRSLGAENDDDLEWVCGGHHAEITTYGSIQPATDPQRQILRGHHYGEQFIAVVTYGAAYELIGQIGRGEVRSPVQCGF